MLYYTASHGLSGMSEVWNSTQTGKQQDRKLVERAEMQTVCYYAACALFSRSMPQLHG
jgi:hypothetical protein